MATIGDLWVNLNAKTDNFEKGMDKASNKATSLGSVIGKIGQNIASFMIYDVGKNLITGFVNAAKAGIDYNATLETSSIKWETLLGSQEKANKMLKDIEKFAADTPFEKMGVEAMATQLHNAGFSGQALFDQLTKFGDLSGAFGIQADSLQEMVRQYAQVKQAGVAYTEDLNILQDRGIPIYKALAEELNINTADVKKWASEGKISADIYQSALDNLASSVEGGMAKQSKSFSGMVSTLKDNMSQAAGILAQPIFDKLKQSLENVLPYVENVISSLSENGLMGTIQRFAPGIEPFVQTAIAIFQTMGETVGVIIQSMTNFWNEHSSWLMPLISFVWTFISTFIMNTITAIGNVVQSGLAIIDGIINFFQNLFQGNFQGCWESIKQIFSNALTFVWNWMQVQFAVNLPNMIKNFGKNFKLWIDDAWVAVKNFFKNGASNVWSTAKSGFSNVLNSIIQYMKQVPTNVKNFMTDAVNKIKSFNLFQIGKDLIQGLINGVKSMGKDVIGALGNIVQNGIDAAKKKLGINSPSKVFTQFGKWTGEGLAIGIDSENNRVAKASEGLSNSVIGGYNANLKGIKTNLNNTIDSNKSGVSNGLSLNIENFINNREQDIENLAEELAFYLQRKGAF